MWDAFKDAIFICIEFFYNFVHDWGLAIVIVTLIFRLILFPLMQKQIKSTFQMQKFSPLMQEIQTKYADDKQRQSAEMQKLYAESGFNPLAGCLPMILQMPIFIALFHGRLVLVRSFLMESCLLSLQVRPSFLLCFSKKERITRRRISRSS